MNPVINDSESDSNKINAILESVKSDPSYINYWNAYKKIQSITSGTIEDGLQNLIKIAVLSSYTIDPLLACMEIDIRLLNFIPQFYLAPFNQYRQQIIDTSSALYKFTPDITILAIDIESLITHEFFTNFPSLTDDEKKKQLEEVVTTLHSLIITYQEKYQGFLLLNNFLIPSNSPLGLLETKSDFGIKNFYKKINSELEVKLATNNQVFLIDFDGLASFFGKNQVFNHKMNYMGSMKYNNGFFPLLSKEYSGFIKAQKNLSKKCIVLDLDNTLWGGIIGEDGMDGIKLNTNSPGNEFVDFQRLLLSYYQRGIILAINSKNNYDDAIQVIRDHPSMVLRENHFACMRINWQNKAQNMVEIANELNIGLDSLVFFDDNPVERDLIKQTLPEVLVVDLPKSSFLYRKTLEEINDFNVLSLTDEDKKRGEMYFARSKRKEMETQHQSLDDFIKTLEIKVKIDLVDEFSRPRVTRLINKTNQYNLTTRRYTEEEVKEMLENPQSYSLYSLQVKDKFGDEGIVGVSIVKKETDKFVIDSFLMSCRVIGRQIENAFIIRIFKDAKKDNINEIIGEFIPTKKNSMVANFYKEQGFEKVADSDNQWIIHLNDKELTYPEYLQIEG
jgi:FkbH-like protein